MIARSSKWCDHGSEPGKKGAGVIVPKAASTNDLGHVDPAEILAGHMARHIREDGVWPTSVPRLALIRSARPSEPLHALHAPALCIVAQGGKTVLLGDKVYAYGPEQYLTVAVEVPIIGQVTDARPDKPYLCLRLDLDPVRLGTLIQDAGLSATSINGSTASSLCLARSSPELMDAAIRLVRLLDTPDDATVLAPLVERELLYRVLLTHEATRLREIAFADSRLRRVTRAVAWIKRTYREPFSVAAVAEIAGMSSSSLHAHFKAVTGYTPLQYQKQLRLQEARRLLLNVGQDVATAAHSVGYDSPSQFSREYRRVYGAPPARDLVKLRLSIDPPEIAIV